MLLSLSKTRLLTILNLISRLERNLLNKNLRTYSIEFNDEQYNESSNQLLITRQLQSEHRKIVISEALLESVINECSIKDFKQIKKFKGKELKGTICNHPFFNLGYDYDIPMLQARFVTTEQGTGIVHCAPSHGPDDFNLCINNGI